MFILEMTNYIFSILFQLIAYKQHYANEENEDVPEVCAHSR